MTCIIQQCTHLWLKLRSFIMPVNFITDRSCGYYSERSDCVLSLNYHTIRISDSRSEEVLIQIRNESIVSHVSIKTTMKFIEAIHHWTIQLLNNILRVYTEKFIIATGCNQWIITIASIVAFTHSAHFAF